MAYLNDLEKLEDEKSLITILIKKRDQEQILSLTTFFRRLKGTLTENQKQKIIPLWDAIIEVSDKDNEATQKTISSLGNWLALIDRID